LDGFERLFDVGDDAGHVGGKLSDHQRLLCLGVGPEPGDTALEGRAISGPL
jgi:hypothetical protein